MKENICIVNGEFQLLSQASLPVQDVAILRGYGIFDFFRTANGTPLFIDHHLERFEKGAKTARLPLAFSLEQLKEQILQLMSKNQISASGIRLMLTGGIGNGPYAIGKPNLVITEEPFSFPAAHFYEEGIKIISHDYLRDLPEIKTINYMTGIYLQQEVVRQNAFDVLYTPNGMVRELTRSNLFMVTREGVLVTPEDQVLWGITRKHVLELAREWLTVELRDFTLDELYQASEVFLTGTTKRVLPIRQVDDRVIGTGRPGEITGKLMKQFQSLEKEQLLQV
jgi:D-alanine transaminase/branched-chain amino acid aminotransferase